MFYKKKKNLPNFYFKLIITIIIIINSTRYNAHLTSNPKSINVRFVEVSDCFSSFRLCAEPNKSKLPALTIPKETHK